MRSDKIQAGVGEAGGDGGQRLLKAITIVMGVLIIAGSVTLGVLLVRRAGGFGPGPEVTADLPGSARVTGRSLDGDRLVVDLVLADGTAAVAVIDLVSGRRVALVRLPALDRVDPGATPR